MTPSPAPQKFDVPEPFRQVTATRKTTTRWLTLGLIMAASGVGYYKHH